MADVCDELGIALHVELGYAHVLGASGALKGEASLQPGEYEYERTSLRSDLASLGGGVISRSEKHRIAPISVIGH